MGKKVDLLTKRGNSIGWGRGRRGKDYVAERCVLCVLSLEIFSVRRRVAADLVLKSRPGGIVSEESSKNHGMQSLTDRPRPFPERPTYV